MGANTSNVASAVSNVSNYVSNSTVANTSQVNEVSQSVNFKNCSVRLKGDLNVTEKASIAIKNNQIVSSSQNTDLTNNIAQQMLQEATSKVGSLGVGYASASNSASEFVNDTNQIMQNMSVSANQFNWTDNSFTCDNSYIEANNINIDLSSSGDFLSSQMLSNDQVSKIVNDVSQSITQKATATVEGLTGILIAIAIIIASLGYSLTKPLNTGAVKMVVGVVVSIVIVMIGAFMYVRKCPPLFNDNDQCVPYSSVGGTSDCINLTVQNMKLDKTPLRYNFGLTPLDTSLPGGNLMQMAIAKLSKTSSNNSGDNGGYRMDIANRFDSIIPKYSSYATNIGVPNIPNPLILPGNSYVIPRQYVLSGGTSSDNISGKCTPGILQVNPGSAGSLDNCPNKADPGALTAGGSDPSQVIANVNVNGWTSYLNGASPISPTDTPKSRSLFARFVLCDILTGIDLNIYVDDNELVKYTDNDGQTHVGLAKDNKNACMFFFTQEEHDDEWRNGIATGGTLRGNVGVFNDNNYKFHNFMRKIGIWILMGLLILSFGYMFFTWWKNRKAGKEEENKEK